MSRFKCAMLWLMGLFYIGAGINHFVNPDFYVKIMPPYLPWHRELVYLSGVSEVVLGALVLVPRWRTFAAWGLVALLVAVFPSNLHMAMNSHLYPDIPAWALWVRLPMQGVLIAWAYWFIGSPLSMKGEPDK